MKRVIVLCVRVCVCVCDNVGNEKSTVENCVKTLRTQLKLQLA